MKRSLLLLFSLALIMMSCSEIQSELNIDDIALEVSNHEAFIKLNVDKEQLIENHIDYIAKIPKNKRHMVMNKELAIEQSFGFDTKKAFVSHLSDIFTQANMTLIGQIEGLSHENYSDVYHRAKNIYRTSYTSILIHAKSSCSQQYMNCVDTEFDNYNDAQSYCSFEYAAGHMSLREYGSCSSDATTQLNNGVSFCGNLYDWCVVQE